MSQTIEDKVLEELKTSFNTTGLNLNELTEAYEKFADCSWIAQGFFS